MKATRKQFSAEQKIAILREHLLEKVPVSELCEKHGLKPSAFYQWQKTLFENGGPVFTSGSSKTAEKELSAKIDALSKKLARKDEIIAEIMEEHIALKKEFGEL